MKIKERIYEIRQTTGNGVFKIISPIIFSKELKPLGQSCVCIPMFIKAFLKVAKIWKQLTLPSIVEGMNKV